MGISESPEFTILPLPKKHRDCDITGEGGGRQKGQNWKIKYPIAASDVMHSHPQ
jgi:hypothetical protein